jgi:hypothetical protein
MKIRRSNNLIREGPYVVEIDDAFKLDDVRPALLCGDIEAASYLGRLYTLMPVNI